MGLFDGTGGMSPADVAAVTNGNNGFGFGGDGAWWLLVLFLFMFNGNNWGGNGTDANMQRGFDQSAVMAGLNGIQGAVTGGFGDTALALSQNQMATMQQGFNAQTAVLQGFNNLQSQFANCCCENRLGIANLGADIAREACADRQAVSEALMNLTAQENANTNAIINNMTAGFQSLKDQMCQDKIDEKNEEIANLRTQINLQNLATSQAQQTAALVADNTAQTQYIVNRVAPYPIPSYTVPNPFTPATATNG